MANRGRSPAARFQFGIWIADLSTEIFHVQAAAFNDAFQRADGNGFAAVHVKTMDNSVAMAKKQF